MNGTLGQSNDLNNIDLLNGENSLNSAINNVLNNGLTTNIDLLGQYQVLNTKQYLDLNSYPNNSLPDVAWCKAYLVSQGQPGQLAPLNTINQALPLTGALDLTLNAQQTLVNDCVAQSGNKQAVNSGTLYNTQQTLQTGINTVQTNLDTETTNRTNADSNLQSQITTLSNRTLDQIPVAVNTVNLNNQILNNVSRITQGNANYLQFDTVGQTIKTNRDLQKGAGVFPTNPTANSYVTLSETQTAIQNTSVSNMVQPQISGSSSRTVAIIDSNKLLQNPSEPVAFQSDLSAYALQSSLDTEVTNRTNADTTLQTEIDTINTNLTNYALQSSLNTEITNRQNADTTLQNNINTLSTNLSTNYSTTTQMNSAISTAVATETTNRQNADTTLQNEIDATNTNLSNNYYTKTQSDGKYYLNTTTLNNITLANGTINANNNKIQNVTNPTQQQDVVTLNYFQNNVPASGLPSNATLNYIATTNPTSGDVSLNSNKLTNVSNAVSNTDATNLGQTNSLISTALVPYSTTTVNDSRYYLSSTALNNITSPSSALSLNSQKIINLLDPTLAQDAVSLNYLQTNNYTKTQSDARYYLSSTTLNSIIAPNGSLSLNSQKITNLLDPTLAQDAVSLNYLQTNNYTKTQSDTNFMPISRTLSQIQQQNPISTNLDLYTGTTAKVYIPTITDTISVGYDKQAMNLDYYNSLQKIVEHIYLTTSTLPTSNNNTTGWAIQQQQASTLNLIVFSANQITLKGNNTYKIILRAQNITANNNNANATYQIQTNTGTPLISANSATLSLSPPTSNLQTNLGGNIEILYTPVADTIIRCFCSNLSGVLSINLDWHIQLMPTSYSVAVSPSLINTQVFSQIYTNFTNNANFQILHNLALPLDQLAVQVYIRFKANTIGWTTTDWLQVWALDRINITTDCGGFQLTTDSSNPNNAFLFCIANNGMGVISKVGQNYNNYNSINFDFKIVASSIGSYVVSQQAFASSALSVNSNIDFLNVYKIINLPTPVSSGDALTKGYLDGQNYQTQTSADARYYLQTTRLNNILAPNGTLNMNSQKITGLGLATANTDAVSLTQLNNYTPVSIYASDLSTNISCNTNLITGIGSQKWSANGIQTSKFGFIFNTNSSAVSVPSTISAGMLINDQINQTGSADSRWSLFVQASATNTSPSLGTNGQALLCLGVTYVGQRPGAGQTTSTDLLYVEGIAKANQFVQWTPSRREFKKQIQEYITDETFLQLQPVTYFYDPDSEYVQEKSIGTDKKMFGFIYEDIQQLCNKPQFFLDDNQLNLTQIKDEMLFTLWNENKLLKQQLSSMQDQINQIMARLQ